MRKKLLLSLLAAVCCMSMWAQTTGPASNEIWYTSSTGEAIENFVTEMDATSNTYTDGKGVATFASDVTEIPDWAFFDCTALTSITLPEGLLTIGESAFFNCTSLDFVVPATVTTIGEGAFGYDEEEFPIVGIPDGVLSFADGYSTTIALYAFYGVYFSSVILSEGMTEIGYASFMSCEYLKSIVIPKSMKTIGDYAFMNCINLTSVTIPEGVTSIGSQAFSDCSNLKEVTMLCTTPPTVDEHDTWYGISGDAVLVVPSGCKSTYETAGWDAWFTIKEAEPLDATGPASNEIWYTSTDGNPVAFDFSSIGEPVKNEKPDGKDYFVATFASDVTSLTHDYGVSGGYYPTLKTMTVPACLESLGKEGYPLFKEMGNFESITFPEDSKLNYIGPRCFEKSGLKSICIPKGVTELSSNSFYECPSLETVTYAEGSQLATIGESAFAYSECYNTINIPASVKTIKANAFNTCTDEYSTATITFAEGCQLETIGEQAFGLNILESITIPASVKNIGSAIFYGSTIGTIILEGTPETIASDAFDNIWGPFVKYEESDIDIVYSMYSLLLWGEEKTSEDLTAEEKTAIIEAAEADDWYYHELDSDMPEFFSTELVTKLILPAGWTGMEYVDEETPWYEGYLSLVNKAQEVTEVGWTSMYLDYNYTLSIGAVAFYASKAEGNTITLQPIQGVIPANTGVIIKAPKESTLCITKTTETPTTTITDNLFRGVTEDTDNPGDVYVLSPETTESNPVFQNYTGAKLGANKAYILKSDLGANASNTLRFVIGGKATGIETVSADDTITTATYNMAGQRVSDDYRGLVIKNGKKMWNN